MSDKLFVVTIKVPGMKEIPTYNVEIEEKFRSKHHEVENENLFAISCPKCQEFLVVNVKLIPDQLPKLENEVDSIIVETLEIKKEEQVSDPLQEPPEPPPLPPTKTSFVRRSYSKRPKPQRSLLCDHCGRSYTRKDFLERHINIHHRLGENLLVCPHCGIKFSKMKLNYHIRAMHGPAPFECDLCSDRPRFKRKKHIAKHMRKTHWSDRPMMCEFEGCGKLFKTGGQRNRHRAACHNTDRQRLFSCTLCPKTFYDRGGLAAHSRLHRSEIRFSCSECGKGFYSMNKMRVHMVVHYPVPRFECKYCGKRFARKPALLVHERIHTGVRDYLCTYPGCTSRFYDVGTLRQHKLFHVKRDKGLVNMRLPDVAKLHHRQGKFYWEEGYPKSDEERN